jgi:Fe-S cluster assembly protein SufD
MNIQPANLEARDRPGDAAAQLISQYKALASELPGSDDDHLQERREQAVTAFAARGLPNRRVEEWKYTDLRAAMREAYAPAAANATAGASLVASALGELAAVEAAARLVFVDGRLRADLSSLGTLPSGVELLGLAEALARPRLWVSSGIGGAKTADDDVVSQLNLALAADGVALRVGKGVILDAPVHFIHIAASDRPASSSLRNVIVVEDGAQVRLIETFVSGADLASQISSVTEIAVADGGRLQHYTVVAENSATQHLASTHVRLGGGADYLAVQFAAGNSLSRLQTFVTYQGEGTRAHFYGCQLLRDRQHCDMTLVIDHAAVGCESREHVKAVVDGNAQGVFQAKVIVRPGAQKTDGRQMAQAMLLSDTAEFDAKPELEIYADDVKCNHGATSGAIDEDLLFYLRARGIPEPQARALLIQAFIGEVLDKIEHEGLRQALEAKAAAWLLPQG